jgi:HprK-related kinase A
MTLGELGRTEAARSLHGAGVTLRCGPLVVRLGSALPELVDPLTMLCQDFPLEGNDRLADFDVRVEVASPLVGRGLRQARAFVDGRGVFDPFPRRQALPMFEWAFNWCTFTQPNRFLLLHAGVVERGGHGLLLSGTPGTGKSTLAAGLIFDGWRLLSDELAVVRPGTRDLLPVPRPVSLKNESIAIVRALSADAPIGPAVSGTRKGTVAHLRPPPESVRRADEPAVPRWIVFPKFKAGAETALAPLSRARALLEAGAEAFNYSIPRHGRIRNPGWAGGRLRVLFASVRRPRRRGPGARRPDSRRRGRAARTGRR